MGSVKSDENIYFLYLCVKNSRGNGQVCYPELRPRLFEDYRLTISG